MIIVERYFGEDEDRKFLDEFESLKSKSRLKPLGTGAGAVLGAGLGAAVGGKHKVAGAMLGSGLGSIGGYYAGKKLHNHRVKANEAIMEKYRNSSEEEKKAMREDYGI